MFGSAGWFDSHSMSLFGPVVGGGLKEGGWIGVRFFFRQTITTTSNAALLEVTYRPLLLESDFLPVWVFLEGAWVDVCLCSLACQDSQTERLIDSQQCELCKHYVC